MYKPTQKGQKKITYIIILTIGTQTKDINYCYLQLEEKMKNCLKIGHQGGMNCGMNHN